MNAIVLPGPGVTAAGDIQLPAADSGHLLRPIDLPQLLLHDLALVHLSLQLGNSAAFLVSPLQCDPERQYYAQCRDNSYQSIDHQVTVPFCQDGFAVETENNIGGIVGDLSKDQDFIAALHRQTGLAPIRPAFLDLFEQCFPDHGVCRLRLRGDVGGARMTPSERTREMVSVGWGRAVAHRVMM